MDRGRRNAAWAGAFVDELVRAGVTEASLAPGSRSTPLVLALARTDAIRITPHVDERSAAFHALGVGKRSRTPAVVVTTSGTAAANLYPAVIEAAWSETPLVVCTADRPHHLRGADANQAIDQLRLYGPYVREFVEVAPARLEARPLRHLRAVAVRAVASATGPPAGPVHLNFPFEKPLEPDPGAAPEPPAGASIGAGGRGGEAPVVRIGPRGGRPDGATVSLLSGAVEPARRGLVVAGPSPDPDAVGPAVLALAGAAGYPVLADPLSGARYGPGATAVAVPAYELLLRDPGVREALAPELVIRVGAAPTSAAVHAFLEGLEGARQVVIDAGARWKDHLAVASDYLRAEPAPLLREAADAVSATPDADWRELWRRVGEAAGGAAAREVDAGFLEGRVLARTAASLPRGATLFVASSMPVRDLDAFGAPRDEPLRVLGNRGASGIDGLVSTALGVARAEGGPVTAVLGDLALCHDMNGLLAARRDGPPVVFVVVNNDGGGIFHTLPVREHEPAFTPYFATPHGLEIEKVADLYGLPYARSPGARDLPDLLAEALESRQSRVIEVPSDRERNRRRLDEVERAVREAVREALA